jgi:O-acetylhomoserine/O-acetylserine sulfhydrylase-like pyridoxal-dependent enzyme
MQSDPLTPYGNKPMVTPIVSAVNYEYVSFDVLKKITNGEIDGYTYHRDDNPTIRTQEKRLALLEEANDCIIATTGMAALTMVFLTYLKHGDHLLTFYDVYGANYKVSLILEKFGVEITWINADDYKNVDKHIKPNTKMIFVKPPVIRL